MSPAEANAPTRGHARAAEAVHGKDPTLVRARPRPTQGGTGLAQPRYGSRPASRRSPTDPALRANPYPEVTDLTCRLPLPTLFYRPEAVHLGDLLRIWVRPGTRIRPSPSDFHGPARAHRTPQEPRCFTGLKPPISGPADSRMSAPYQEKRTLPGAPASVSEFDCVAAPAARGSDIRARVREY